MERPSQPQDGALHDPGHDHGPEFDPDEPPPPYSVLPEPGLIQNQSTDTPRQMSKPCVVPRRPTQFE